jgi:hypothetical protein
LRYDPQHWPSAAREPQGIGCGWRSCHPAAKEGGQKLSKRSDYVVAFAFAFAFSKAQGGKVESRSSYKWMNYISNYKLMPGGFLIFNFQGEQHEIYYQWQVVPSQ